MSIYKQIKRIQIIITQSSSCDVCRRGQKQKMKKINYLVITSALVSMINFSFAQNINWKNLEPSQKHIVNLNVGFDNATVVGIGYGYHLQTKMPLVLNVEYSMPLGDNHFDDFKTKIGGQLNVIQAGNFFTTVKAYGVFRRYQNDYARMFNFGSEFSATAGWYAHKWFAAGEFGFDKAITTKLQHSNLMKEYNPGLQSGWYIPDGGNFLYGLQAGYSFHRNDVYAKVGRTVAQDLKTKAIMPLYFQLGVTRKL